MNTTKKRITYSSEQVAQFASEAHLWTLRNDVVLESWHIELTEDGIVVVVNYTGVGIIGIGTTARIAV